LHEAFQVPPIYDYMTKLVMQQVEVKRNANFRNTGKGEVRHRKYTRLKRGGGQAHDRSID
jgi:hypothetical protein